MLELHTDKIAAINAFGKMLNMRPDWPPLNLTVEYNRRGVIICEQTGQIFYSQADIARVHKVNVGQISNHLQRLPGYAHVKGMTFKRCEFLGHDRKNVSLPRAVTSGYRARASNKAVQCVETGQIFKSQKMACDTLGLNPGQLSQHLRGMQGVRHVKGMTFRLVEPEPMPPRTIYP